MRMRCGRSCVGCIVPISAQRQHATPAMIGTHVWEDLQQVLMVWMAREEDMLIGYQ